MKRITLAVLAAAAIIVPATTALPASAAPAHPAARTIPAGGPYWFQNFNYSCVIAWADATPWNSECTTNNWAGTYILVGSGTWQVYQDDSVSGNVDLGYYNADDSIRSQAASGATWQQWASLSTPNGWVIYNRWFAATYPHWCPFNGTYYQAVVTTNGVNGKLYLSCPEGIPGQKYPLGCRPVLGC
jgi:hypothetical protein